MLKWAIDSTKLSIFFHNGINPAQISSANHLKLNDIFKYFLIAWFLQAVIKPCSLSNRFEYVDKF